MSLVRKWVVDSLFANKAVVLFSHSACCTNCRKVKSIVDEVTLSRFGITPVVIELEELPDADEIKELLMRRTVGRNFTPSLWVYGFQVGFYANSVINFYESGELGDKIEHRLRHTPLRHFRYRRLGFVRRIVPYEIS